MLDYDHGTADPPSIAGDEHRPMVVIDIHAHEFAESAGPAQLPEITDKARWISR